MAAQLKTPFIVLCQKNQTTPPYKTTTQHPPPHQPPHHMYGDWEADLFIARTIVF